MGGVWGGWAAGARSFVGGLRSKDVEVAHARIMCDAPLQPRSMLKLGLVQRLLPGAASSMCTLRRSACARIRYPDVDLLTATPHVVPRRKERPRRPCAPMVMAFMWVMVNNDSVL